MKRTLAIFFAFGYSSLGFSQVIVNGDLNGSLDTWSDLPTNWQAIPYDDPNCNAMSPILATPDLTSLNGPDSIQGVIGNPYSDSTFVSGLDASIGMAYWHEGIQQTVTGFTPETEYQISFYQTVVKQENSVGNNFYVWDSSGSWSVFLDDELIATTEVSISALPFNSINLIWDFRNIQFTATSSTHTLKFLPTDNDDVSEIEFPDSNGGLRMGIDNIALSTVLAINNEMKTNSVSVFPNPTSGILNLDLKTVYKSIKLELFDINGRVAMHNTYTNSKDISIVLNVDRGIYFLRIKTEKGELNDFKIIKK